MKRRIWVCNTMLIIACFLDYTMGREIVEETKEEASIPNPITSMSPLEGNTTFLDGTTWCIAHPSASPVDLQIALDWACGVGNADCRPIQAGGPCYQPNSVVYHASYAFNIYYQQNGNNAIACNFGGTATLTKRDPSYGKCLYDVTRPERSLTKRLDANSIVASTVLLLLYVTIW